MLGLLRLELRRMLGDARFLILMLVMPVGMYLLFTNLFGAAGATGQDAYAHAMVSMAAFGAIGAALTATAPRIALERANGWLRQLRVLPVSPARVVTAKVLSAMCWALPAIVLVFATAVVDHGVTLPGWRWVAVGALLWVGTAPFAALGALLGYVTGPDAAFGVMFGIYLFLAAVGGLWMPVEVLPTVLQHIAVTLPSNRFAELGWRLVSGGSPSAVGAVILAGWLVLLAALAGVGYRRANAVR